MIEGEEVVVTPEIEVTPEEEADEVVAESEEEVTPEEETVE